MSFHKIEPILNNLADTLSNAAVALQSEHPVSVAQLIEMLICTSQALRSVSPVIGELVKSEDNQSFIICCVRDNALQLLFSMDETQANTYPASAIEKMPHLFRKLNWWEERKVEDMPDYVKWDVGIYPTWKKIMKVDKWNSNGSFDHENVTISVINCFPATEQQYNDYINSKSNAKP